MKLLLFFHLLIISCNITTSNEKLSKNIYAKFMVALGEDITNEMQCVAEFFKDPDDLKPIALEKGSKVLLDNQELEFDPSPYPNFISERKASEFIGKHKWTVNLGSGAKNEYEFEVAPFNIISSIPEKIGTTDIKVECENLKSTDEVTLMLSGDLSSNSENFLEIKPQDGYFIIPKTFLEQVDPIKLEMHFNLSRIQRISGDDYFGKGVEIEWTKVTKHYTTTVIR